MGASGCVSAAVVVRFTQPGTLGIEWDAETVLDRPNHIKEVMSMVPGGESAGGGALPGETELIEVEYGCRIADIQAGSPAAAEGGLTAGLCLRA